MPVETVLLFILGLVALIVGAELLVRGASRLAAAVGLSPLIIGLTVVAYGTSAPELAVSVQSGWQGQADIAIGNVLGSNIFNVLVVLGVSALIAPLAVSSQLIRYDVPLMIGVSGLLFVLALDGRVGRLDGALLFAGALFYTGLTLWKGRQSQAGSADDPAGRQPTSTAWLLHGGLIVLGLALLVLGSRWLVQGAVVFATLLGVDELVIGLTIVAAGTSLPEVATSVIASLRGERDIAVGNVVGSNIFNVLAVLGLTSLVIPRGVQVVPAVLRFDLPVMLAVAVACLPIFFTGNRIARWEGGLFLGYYGAYTMYLILAATQHQALPGFSAVMLLFVIPLTGITLLVLALRAWRSRVG